FQRYTAGHKYRPRAFTSAFTSQHKNTQLISVKDRTIGRPGSTASVLTDEDDDNDHHTFPDNADISNDAAVNMAPEENVMSGNESEDNSDDNSDDDSGNEGDYEEDQQAGDQPIDAERPKKRAFKKITYTKSSRMARDADVPVNENAVARKINPTNLMADVVASLHPMRAMKPGRIESCLIHSLKESFLCMNDQDRSLLSGHLLETMHERSKHTLQLMEAGDKSIGTKEWNTNNILLKGKRETFFWTAFEPVDQMGSRIKTEAGITEIEDRLVQRQSVEAKLGVDDSDVVMEGDSGIPSSSQYAVESFAASVEEAIRNYESAVKAHLVNVASEASTLRSFYGSTRFKQDKYDYREAQRHDLDKAAAAILRMWKHVPDRQPSDEELEKVLDYIDEDIKSVMEVVNGLLNVKGYDWASYLQLMDEIKEHSGIERETFLKSKSVMRRRKKIALSLYKRGFLDLNTLPDDKRNAFLQSPLVIGLGDDSESRQGLGKE
ncbi:hypothetical protein BGZ79_001945, partial [Entomortierella chlamydospora]